MQTVFHLIPMTIIYVICIVLIINYILLEQIKVLPNIPDYFKYVIYSFVFYFLYGYLVSYYASKKKCDQTNKTRAIYHGLKSFIYVFVTYTAIYMFLPLRNPFVQLFGENRMGTSITEIFYISLNLLISIITNYFDSVKYNCKVTPDKLKDNLKKLDKYLAKKPVKRRQRNIIVKD